MAVLAAVVPQEQEQPQEFLPDSVSAQHSVQVALRVQVFPRELQQALALLMANQQGFLLRHVLVLEVLQVVPELVVLDLVLEALLLGFD